METLKLKLLKNLFFYFLVSIVLFISILGCIDDSSDTEEPCLGEKNILISCILVYEPVCGCDGKTYSNACIAEAEGVLRFTSGECN